MHLPFEKKIMELEEKIHSLQAFAQESEIDLSQEIAVLEEKLQALKRETYEKLSPWDKVTLARLAERPTALDYIEQIFDDFIELHGDRLYGDDPAIVGGIATLGGVPVTVIGHQKGRSTKENIRRNFGMPHPEGYRKALRLMKQAEKFQRPVICFIDTPGAFCGIGAEERGQGEAIARNLMEMAALQTPILSVVIGEGGSGGALALGVADRVWMLEHSIYAVLSPEGFASILWKDGTRGKEAAEIMKLTAQDLATYGIIDQVIPEPLGGAHKDPKAMAQTLKEALTKELPQLMEMPMDVRLEGRYQKFRRMGSFLEG